MDFENVLSLIKGDLDDVEGLISKNLNNQIPLIFDIGSYLSSGKGKRIRPILVLLSSKLNGYEGRRSIIHSTAVELIHMATLLHDDVVDGADRRRGYPSVNSKWGNQASILVGDYLFARSFSLLAEDNDIKIIDSISKAVVRMAEGEIMQLARNDQLTEDEKPYMEIINRKTASLMSCCCEIGAILSNNGKEGERISQSFGLDMGMAFQLVDDALDYVAEEDKLGKSLCKDLRDGHVTLPLIYLYRTVNGNNKKRIKDIVESDIHIGKEEVELIITMMKDYGAIDYTFKIARDHIEKAKEKISVFDNSIYLKALITLADYIVDRDFKNL